MNIRTLSPALLSAALLAACGGGGSSSSTGTTPTPPAATTTLSGVASKGPLKQALVTAFKVDDAGTLGAKIAEVQTDATGAYTLDVGSYTGAVQLVVTVIPGKTTSADEASGQDVTLPDSFTLHANTVVAAGSSNQIQSASITPYTELANQIAKDSGGLSKTNIANAAKVVFDLIGVDPVATQPIAFGSAAPAGATDAQKRYALYNAAVSQLAASTPATSDAGTLACYTAAGTDLGKKIQCATSQIASAVTVAGSGSAATASVNKKLVGLGDALISASSDSKNKTGAAITASDADAKRLDAIETEVKQSASGTAPPVKLDVPAETLGDIAKAKQFFTRLRANAAAIENGPLETGLADGVQAFADSVNTGALAVTGETGQLVRLSQTAFQLWADYTSGATTNPNSLPIAGVQGGCTVFEGSFPAQFGPVASAVGADGSAGAAYVAGSVTATGASAATWVGCAINPGTAPTSTNKVVQYRRSMLFNMAASSAAGAVPYIAITRKRYYDATSTLVHQNLTPTLSGTVTVPPSAVNGATLALVGDLPPSVGSSGSLMAARYAANLQAVLSTLANGATQLALTSGSFSVVPVGSTTAGLTVDLSPGGATMVALTLPDPALQPTAAQLATYSFSLGAAIKTPKGELKGTLLADQFALDSLGDVQPGHMKFVGTIAAAGKATAVATVLTGTLEATQGSNTETASFEGVLALPGRPTATLTLSATRTRAANTGAVTNTAITGRYVQDTTTVQITGNRTASSQTLTLADSAGVSVSVNAAANSATVTVSGRTAGTIDTDRGRITYADGTFESLN